jgi:hypothetical protein
MGLQQDRITKMPVNMDDKHYLVHEGRLFSLSYESLDLDIATPQKLLFRIGSRDLHYVSVLGALGGSVKLELYRSPTVTAAGTEIAGYNNNEDSSNTISAKGYHTPTTTANGTLCAPPRRALGSAQGASSSGSSLSGGSERILKANTDYLVIITTDTDNTKYTYYLEGYEEDED